DQAAAAFGWKNRTPQPRSMRDDDWLVGFGCATAVYPTHIGAAAARVRLMANGDVRVQTAAHEIGNGVYTVLAQIAAERLAAKLDAVTVDVGDSRLLRALVAGGSPPPASTCSAVLKTCDAIRSKLFRAAVTSNQGPFAGRDPAPLTLNDGKIKGPDGAEQRLEDVFKGMGVSSIEEYSEFVPRGLEPKAMADLYRRQKHFQRRLPWGQGDVCNGGRIRRGSRPRFPLRNSRTADCRRLRRRPADQYPDGAQPADGRNDLGHQLRASRSDGARPETGKIRQ